MCAFEEVSDQWNGLYRYMCVWGDSSVRQDCKLACHIQHWALFQDDVRARSPKTNSQHQVALGVSGLHCVWQAQRAEG